MRFKYKYEMSQLFLRYWDDYCISKEVLENPEDEDHLDDKMREIYQKKYDRLIQRIPTAVYLSNLGLREPFKIRILNEPTKEEKLKSIELLIEDTYGVIEGMINLFKPNEKITKEVSESRANQIRNVRKSIKKHHRTIEGLNWYKNLIETNQI